MQGKWAFAYYRSVATLDDTLFSLIYENESEIHGLLLHYSSAFGPEFWSSLTKDYQKFATIRRSLYLLLRSDNPTYTEMIRVVTQAESVYKELDLLWSVYKWVSFIYQVVLGICKTQDIGSVLRSLWASIRNNAVSAYMGYMDKLIEEFDKNSSNLSFASNARHMKATGRRLGILHGELEPNFNSTQRLDNMTEISSIYTAEVLYCMNQRGLFDRNGLSEDQMLILRMSPLMKKQVDFKRISSILTKACEEYKIRTLMKNSSRKPVNIVSKQWRELLDVTFPKEMESSISSLMNDVIDTVQEHIEDEPEWENLISQIRIPKKRRFQRRLEALLLRDLGVSNVSFFS